MSAGRLLSFPDSFVYRLTLRRAGHHRHSHRPSKLVMPPCTAAHPGAHSGQVMHSGWEQAGTQMFSAP